MEYKHTFILDYERKLIFMIVRKHSDNINYVLSLRRNMIVPILFVNQLYKFLFDVL